VTLNAQQFVDTGYKFSYFGLQVRVRVRDRDRVRVRVRVRGWLTLTQTLTLTPTLTLQIDVISVNGGPPGGITEGGTILTLQGTGFDVGPVRYCR